MKLKLVAALSILCCAVSVQAKDIKIAHLYSKTGPLELYAKQSMVGIMLGLEYATGGTMTINGRKIVVIEKDDQGRPDIAKSRLSEAYEDDKVDLTIGPSGSGVAIAVLPIAEEHKKVLVVDAAVADAITGERWNRYIFRTSRNSSMDAVASAVVVDKPGTSIATMAQDYSFGRDGVKAFKGALTPSRPKE